MLNLNSDHKLMNTEATHELRELAQDFTYNFILHAGLAKELSNEEWDSLAASMADKAMVFVEGLVDREFERLEKKEAA